MNLNCFKQIAHKILHIPKDVYTYSKIEKVLDEDFLHRLNVLLIPLKGDMKSYINWRKLNK